MIRGASAWKAEVSSSSTSGGDAGGADALIDGDANTYWHSNYGEGTGEPNKLPVTATIDRGGSKDVFQTGGYLPRSTSANGNWQEFELYASDDEKDLFSEKNKQKSSAGATTFKVLYNGMYGEGDQAGAKMIYFGLEKEIKTRYVGFKVLKGQGGNFAAGAEIDLFSGEAFTSYPDADATEIKASDLTIEKVVESDAQGDGGKMLTFDFAPFTYGTDSSADIEMKVVMDDNDHYMRKWIELETSEHDDEDQLYRR